MDEELKRIIDEYVIAVGIDVVIDQLYVVSNVNGSSYICSESLPNRKNSDLRKPIIYFDSFLISDSFGYRQGSHHKNPP
jgi:hypothetical protein